MNTEATSRQVWMVENKTVISFSISPYTKLKREKREQTRRGEVGAVCTQTAVRAGEKSQACPPWRTLALAAPHHKPRWRKQKEQKESCGPQTWWWLLIGDCGKWTLSVHQSQWLHSKSTVAHLHSCVYPHNWYITLKSFWYTQHASTPLLSSALFSKYYCKEQGREDQYHFWWLPWSTADHLPQQDIGTCYNQNWSLLLSTECPQSGIQTLLMKRRSGTKGLQEKALKHLFPTVNQFLLHPGVPLVFNLPMAIRSSIPLSSLASLRWLDHLYIPQYPVKDLILDKNSHKKNFCTLHTVSSQQSNPHLLQIMLPNTRLFIAFFRHRTQVQLPLYSIVLVLPHIPLSL